MRGRMAYLLTIAHASTYGVITGGDPHCLNNTMFHTCNAFPARHNDSSVIDDVAAYWRTRGWLLRQPYNNKAKGWNLSGPFHLVGAESGNVGRHYWGYEDLMDHTNAMAAYSFVLTADF